MSWTLFLCFSDVWFQLTSESDLWIFASIMSIKVLYRCFNGYILIILLFHVKIFRWSLVSSRWKIDDYFFRIFIFIVLVTKSITSAIFSRSLYNASWLFYHLFNTLHWAIKFIEIIFHAFNKVIPIVKFCTIPLCVRFVNLHLETILILNFIADLL
jgi:hypothetical protein